MASKQTRARGSQTKSERFGTVSPPGVPRSAFNRSFTHKTTFNSGELVPVFIDEMLPGDTLHLQPSFLARLATPIKPFMDGIHLDSQWWAVPYRLLWENFTKMMGEQANPGDSIDYLIPQVETIIGGHLPGSLFDYFGLPILVNPMATNALFPRAYSLIYNEWYRDENLQTSVPVAMDDGPDSAALYQVKRRGKRKDYFTGALPFAQKGDPVSLPLGTQAPLGGAITVVGVGDETPDFQFGGGAEQTITARSGIVDDANLGTANGGDAGVLSWGTDIKLGSDLVGGFADLTGATAITVNAMRQAITLQHLLERDARGGTRYIEQNLAHFGVISEDSRLQRPEILATGSMTIAPYAIAQQSNTPPDNADNLTPQGNLAAYAMGSSTGRGFVKTFTEHMIVMGIISVRAELTYQQGLHRMHTRRSRFDHYFPDLAHLGEQTVLSGELFHDGSGVPATDTVPGTGDFEVWGYQPRFEEYRFRQSMVTGEFRSAHPQSLDVWHLAQDFATRPVLNSAFIEENPPIERIIELAQPAPEFLLDCYFKIKHVRPMPKFAKPGLLRF